MVEKICMNCENYKYVCVCSGGCCHEPQCDLTGEWANYDGTCDKWKSNGDE